MPYSISTKDGITINNIPDDVDPNSQELKDRVAGLRAGGQDGATATTQGAIAEQPGADTGALDGVGDVLIPSAEAGQITGGGEATDGAIDGAIDGDQGATDEIVRQLGLTLRAGAEGAGSILGIFSDPVAAALNQALPEDQQLSYANETVSGLLTKMGVPEPESQAERIVGQAAQALAGGGGTVAAARGVAKAATGPVTQAVSNILAQSPSQQLAGAALGGGAGQATAEAGGSPELQALAALAGGVGGARLAAPRTPGAIPSVIPEAEQAGVKVLTSDVLPPESFAAKWAQTIGERVPGVGTGPVRAAQQTQRVDAVRNTLRDFGADDTAQLSDDVMNDLLKKRGKDVAKYAKMKGDVIENASAKGGTVGVDNAAAEIDNQIAQLVGLKTEKVAPIIEMLTDFKSSISGQRLDNVETLRGQLGESLKSQDLASVRGVGEKAASKIYGALNKDMGNFIKEVGETRDFTKWSVANKKLSNMMGDLKSTALKSALNKGEVTPEIIKTMLLSKKKSDVSRLYGSLTPDGRRNARGALLQQAASKATNVDGDISPAKFTSELKRQGIGFDVFFKGQDKKAIEGLQRVLATTSRAGDAAVMPQTGAQLALPVGAAVLSDLLGSGGAALASGATIGLAARAYESAPVRNILLKLSKTDKGSKAEADMITKFVGAYQAQRELTKDEK